jgi:excisionase family DNA binding protein
MSDGEVLTVAEVAARLKVRRQFVYERWWAGELEGFRAGRSVRIFAASVQAYIDGRSNVKRSPVPRTPGRPAIKGRLTYYG